MLAIEVSLLTGRYVATAYNTRAESEWPPHPARLFSALAATHFTADPATPGLEAERGLLEWLESQGAPSILASDATAREVVTVFVPVNDVALTDVDEEAAQVDRLRAALAAAPTAGGAKAVGKAERDLTKAETALAKAIARATEVPAKPADPRYGQRLLPEYRGRQPRTFPSVTPVDPRITYVWTEAAPTGDQRDRLDALLARVVRLGHSSSLVSMRLVDPPEPPTWRPAIDGEASLRIVGPGQIRALERAFEHHREYEPRVMPAVPQSYARSGSVASEPPSESVFADDWLLLRRVEGPALPMTAAVGLARTVRKALMSYASEPIPEMLCGHTADGQPSQQPHMAIVPLPFVGHEHATGAILGVALVLPRAANAADRRAVYEAVARWEDQYRREDEDTPALKVNLGPAGEVWLERAEWGALQTSLKPSTWCVPSRVWYSATPVALDRNPGDLRSRDPKKLEAATGEAIEIVARACERVGLPRPAFVEILPAAPWAGSAKARLYPPYPDEPARAQRVLAHVRVEFERPVGGPVLLGAGRYLGLGLLRPKTT
jgi:CRISPR-associated protein Csb2